MRLGNPPDPEIPVEPPAGKTWGRNASGAKKLRSAGPLLGGRPRRGLFPGETLAAGLEVLTRDLFLGFSLELVAVDPVLGQIEPAPVGVVCAKDLPLPPEATVKGAIGWGDARFNRVEFGGLPRFGLANSFVFTSFEVLSRDCTGTGADLEYSCEDLEVLAVSRE